MKKRVVVFCDYFGDGGIEKVITNIKDNIDKSRYKVALLTTICNSQSDYNCIKMSKSKTLNPLIRFLVTVFNIKKYTKDYDIVHINMHNSIDLLYACLIDKNKRIIVHAHNSNFQKDFLNIRKFVNKIFKTLFNRKRFIYVACSLEASKFCFGKVNSKIIKNDFNGEKFVYNSLSRKEIRRKYNINNKTFVIGHIGRFVEQKNHKFLIKVFKEFNDLYSDSLLFMIGDGKLKKNIEKLVYDYKLQDKVLFLDYTNKIEKYYQLFDVFVFPSYFEGYGLCVYEAMCSSLKCFVSKEVGKNFLKNDLLIDISLNESLKYWAKMIYDNMNYKRKNNLVKDNEFIKNMEKIYGSMNEKISIIVPIYNAEETIKECIDSILDQSYINFELILINDGSCDKTKEIIGSYKDKRIKIINQDNHGTGFSRNVGIKNSSGEYFTFIDSDDLVEKNYLEVLYDILIKNNCDISCSSFFEVKNKEKILVFDKVKAFSKLLDLPETIGVGVTRKLFKNEVLDGLLFDEDNHFEDVDFSIRAFLNARKVVYINRKLYICNKKEFSRSSYYDGDDRIRACLESYDKIKNEYPIVFSKYITYSLFNMIGVINMMIINNKYNQKIIKEVNDYINKYIKYVSKTNYPLYKKIQIYLFHYNYSLYKKIYLKVKESSIND